MSEQNTTRRSEAWERAEADWRSQEAATSGRPAVTLTCGHTVPVPAIGGEHGYCAEHGVQRFADEGKSGADADPEVNDSFTVNGSLM